MSRLWTAPLIKTFEPEQIEGRSMGNLRLHDDRTVAVNGCLELFNGENLVNGGPERLMVKLHVPQQNTMTTGCLLG